MQITKIIIENFMKLKLVKIVPGGSVVEIKGANASGKSSLLNAIVVGLRGKKAAPVEAVRRGSKKGKIVIDMDGDELLNIPPFTITSNISNNKIETIIEPKELLKGETPRSFLDKLLGAISFDPLDFINKEGKEQRRVLLNLIGVDVDNIDLKEKDLYEKRTIKGRDRKSQAGKVDVLKFWSDVKQLEPVKVSDLSTKLTNAIAYNNSISIRTQNNDSLKSAAITIKEISIPAAKELIADLERELDGARFALENLETDLDAKRKQFNEEKIAIGSLETMDIDWINQEIHEIEITNSKIRDNATCLAEKEILSTLQSEYDKLEADLDSVRQERINLLQSATMPVIGLSFDESGLLFNDIPLSQCSDGEKLMISMGISMALNPTMKVLRIKDGSLLSKNNLDILREMVRDKEYQLWIEKVQDKDEYGKTGKVGIFIEEGEVEYIDGVEVTNSSTESPLKQEAKSSKVDKNTVEKDEDW